MQIYLDYSATTPPHPEVVATMHRVLTEDWGNPASIHGRGQTAALVLEQARAQVAGLLQAEPEAIIFTSGGTEANNLAILGVAETQGRPGHVIISSVEHAAVAEPVARLEHQGWAVTRLPVDQAGLVDPQDLAQALRPETVLVSIIYGQSEVGTVQPIQTLGTLVRRHGALFHTDAVQVVGRLPVDVTQLPVDLLSLSGHKFYGPQGSGALYVRPGVRLTPRVWGGGQENGLRSGTPALAVLAGLGQAAVLAKTNLWEEAARLLTLREALIDQLRDVTDLQVTGHLQQRLPHHVSWVWAVGGMTGKTLVRQLNLAGVMASSGSACHSGKTQPSPVLLAMGYGPKLATQGLRLTLGRLTTPADVAWAGLALRQVLERLAPVVYS